MIRTLNFRLGLGIVLAAAAAVALVAVAGSLGGARADTSGANPSGYVWIDSNAPDPTVTFEWVDATGGTLSDVEDEDDEWETVTLPFTFNFFGTDYTEVDISSNGFLSFDIDSECNDNYNWDDTLVEESGNPIPYTDAGCEGDSGWGGNPLIASWFDDLDPGECGDVYYETFGSTPNQTFVVQFDDVCHNDCDLCEAGEGISFETILYETSNDIKVQYQDTLFNDDTSDEDMEEENFGATATSGINQDGTIGLGYHWGGDGETLTDNLAVLYTTGAVDVSVTKSASPDVVQVGDELTYTIEVTNNGETPATGVTVTDDLPDGVTYVSSSASQGTCGESAGTVTCELGDLAGGASASVEIVVTVDTDGTISNTASVATDQTNVNADGGTAVLDVTVGAAPTPSPTPTATPAELPDTGGGPGESGFPWLAAIAAGLIAMAMGGLWLRRAASAARS
jgi:uncharacterized repeat protein (TIGR01451 family)